MLRPGVVIDRDRGSVVMMTPEKSIEAVEVATGEVVWNAGISAKPLWVGDARLLAQIESDAGLLELVVFDATNGEPVQRLRAELPKGVDPSIDDSLGHRFELTAVESEDVILVEWTDIEAAIAAVPRLQPEPVTRSGFFRVDLGAEAMDVPQDEPDRRLFQKPPPDLIGETRMEKVEGTQFRSAEGGFAMTSVRVADNRVWDKYEWTIWQREGQEKIGSFRYFQSYTPFAVVDRTLILEVAPNLRREGGENIGVPLSVKAVDLEVGEDLWLRRIRNTAYLGPLPH